MQNDALFESLTPRGLMCKILDYLTNINRMFLVRSKFKDKRESAGKGVNCRKDN